MILNLPLLPLLAVVRSSPALLALADKAAGPVLPKVLTVPKTYHHIKLCERSLPSTSLTSGRGLASGSLCGLPTV